MAVCTGSIRRLGSSVESMKELAEGIVQYFYNNLVLDAQGTKACALVRMFKTRQYSELTEDQKKVRMRHLKLNFVSRQ